MTEANALLSMLALSIPLIGMIGQKYGGKSTVKPETLAAAGNKTKGVFKRKVKLKADKKDESIDESPINPLGGA